MGSCSHLDVSAPESRQLVQGQQCVTVQEAGPHDVGGREARGPVTLPGPQGALDGPSLSNAHVLNVQESTSVPRYPRWCGFSPSWHRGWKESAEPGILALV